MAKPGRGRLIERLVSGIFKTPLERERDYFRHYRELSGLIEESPGNMNVFVLRGELNLERGEFKRARADFEAAMGLAENLDDSKGWNIVEQVLRDRALYGLQLAEREL